MPKALLLLSLPFVSRLAWAEESGPDPSRSRAEALFESGLARQRLGQLQAACESFEASAAVAPLPHALLQVGNCREPLDPVGALASFEAALAAARSVVEPMQRRAYESAALARIEPLSERVPTITFRPSPTLGVSVEIGAEGGVASVVTRFGEPQRFNPGSYRVRAWAPGMETYSLEVALQAGDRLALELPALARPVAALPPHRAGGASADAAGASATKGSVLPGASSQPVSARGEPSALHVGTLPLVLASVGGALVVTSLVTGQISSNARGQLERECSGPSGVAGLRACDESLAGTKRRVEDYALATDMLWVSGALLAGIGVALFVLDQNGPAALRLDAGCLGDRCGASATGSF